MNKEKLIQTVLKEAKLETKKQATAVVDAVFSTITKSLARGEEVALTGFGVFKTVKTAARMGINPKTMEKIKIKAGIKPKFRAGKGLKDAVK